jgi:hypothetical protein
MFLFGSFKKSVIFAIHKLAIFLSKKIDNQGEKILLLQTFNILKIFIIICKNTKIICNRQ